MFPQLSPPHSVSAFVIVIIMGTMAAVRFVQLTRPVRAIEFMAFAGNTRQGNGHEKQGKKFHRGAS